MDVSSSRPVARAPRHAYHRPAQGRMGSKPFLGEVDNISETGAAVMLGDGGIVVDNGMFVAMHVEGLGHLQGKVARRYDGGFAMQFDEPSRDLAALRSTLNRLA